MRYFFLLWLTFISNIAICQITPPDSTLVSDTIESESTDSTIVYIVKKPPVVVKERFEVVAKKDRRKFYVTTEIGAYLFSEILAPKKGYEAYTTAVKNSTQLRPSATINVEIWTCQRKFMTGLSFQINRTMQRFNYTDSLSVKYKITNKFNYSSIGLRFGYWKNKTKKISSMYKGTLHVDYFLSSVGYTLSETNLKQPARINRETSFVNFIPRIELAYTLIFKNHERFVTVSPFLTYTPLSMTSRSEPYGMHLLCYGITIGLTNPIF